MLPASVMGSGAGLELLEPFAVSLLGGLVTSLVVVLVVVPGLYPALAGLDPLPTPPDEIDPGPVDRSVSRPVRRHESEEPS